MTHRNKKDAEQLHPATDARGEHEITGDQSPSCLLTAWEPNQPITIRLKQFLKLTGIGRSTAFEMWNPRSRLYDDKMPVGFRLLSDSSNAPRFFFFRDVIAWLNYRAAQSHSNRSTEKGVLEA